MQPRVLLVGATGLIGETFLNIAGDRKQLQKIKALTRRKITANTPLIEEHIIDFNIPGEYKTLFNADIVVSAVGTTIKKAGSQEAFRKVDYDIPIATARYAYEHGAKYFILVSSVGADPSSKIFYNRVKGEVERDLVKIPFKGIHILRPSLLLGERKEFRLGEWVAQKTSGLYSLFLPSKYKPVKAEVVAEIIHSLCLHQKDGIHIYESLNLDSQPG